MNNIDFFNKKLQLQDYIWIMNNKGEGFYGIYLGEYSDSNQTFKFLNHSNGKQEIIKISDLQRLQKQGNTINKLTL